MKKRWKQKGISLLLTAALLAELVPLSSLSIMTAQAADQPAAPASNAAGTVIEGEVTLEKEKLDGVNGSPTITVKDGATLTLKDVTVAAKRGQSAIYIEKNATLIIEGEVHVTGGEAYYYSTNSTKRGIGAGAGIEVPENSSLTLQGTGVLTVTGGKAGDGRDGNGRLGGRGGGGGGAGIGSKGSSSDEDARNAGAVTIDDKHLKVDARGGAGGNGGRGADGGPVKQIYEQKKVVFIVLFIGNEYIVTYEGGRGGGGGGGGGYPGAGIGSGGTAGLDGCNGGIGGQDTGNAVCAIGAGALLIDDKLSASGGGGGAGGWGYVNGGGGGAGAGVAGYFDANLSYGVGIDSHISDLENAGKGGAPGQDGLEIMPYVIDVKGSVCINAKSGAAGGAGGAAGEATEANRKCTGGGSNNNLFASRKTLSGKVGGVTIKSGLVLAAAGGTENNPYSGKDVGGGGATFGWQGYNSRCLKILGGSLQTANGKLVTPVGGSGETLYPVTLSGQASDETNIRPIVTVNGTDVVTRYGTSDRKVTLWLPNGTHTVTIIQPGAIEYEVTITDGTVSYQTTEPQIHLLNLSKGTLWINGTTWAHGGVSGEFYKNANIIVYGKGDIVVGSSPADYPYNITMDGINGCTVNNLKLSSSYLNDESKKAQVNLTATGTENKIGTLTAMDPNSQITFNGDEDSNLSIGSITAADWKSQPQIVSTRAVSGGNTIGELVLGIGNTRNESVANLKDVKINGVSPIPVEPRLSKNVNLASKSNKWLTLGYLPVTSDTPERNPYYWYDPRYPDDTRILYDIMLVEFDMWSSEPLRVLDLPYGRYEPVNIVSVDYSTQFQFLVREPADLMYGNYDVSIHRFVYALYSDNVNWENWNTRPKEEQNPITHIEHWYYTHEVCGKCYPCKVPLVRMGKDADGNDTVTVVQEDTAWQVDEEGVKKSRIRYSRIWGTDLLNGKHYECMEPGLDSYHGGTVVMNSKGRVIVEKFGSQGTKKAFYGTPDLVVNSGYMEVQELSLPTLPSYTALHGASQYPYYFSWSSGMVTGCYETTTDQKTHHKYRDSDGRIITSDYYGAIYWKDVYGSNRLGDVTVNAGGSLKVGKDGTGSLVKANEFMKGGKLTVESGGMLYSGDSLSSLLEITGLPPNTLLFPIENTKGDGIMGDYDWTVWTDGSGTLRTNIEKPSETKETQLVLADKGGNAYSYTISFAGSAPTAKKDRLMIPRYVESRPMRVYPNYMITYEGRGDMLWGRPGNKTLIWRDDQTYSGSIRLYDGAELTLDTEITAEAPSTFGGNGTLTVTGAGLKGSKLQQINVTSLIVESGTIDGFMLDYHSSIEINGGSVKDYWIFAGDIKALKAFNKAGERLYLTVLPWSTDVTVDGEPYTVSSGSRHRLTSHEGIDPNMYLYLPASAKVVRTTDENGQVMAYLLSPNELTHVMKVTEAISGNGAIDLTNDTTAEIRSDNLYMLNNQLYYNENGNAYTVTGTANSDGTPLTVSGKDIAITLKDANLTSTKKSPIVLAEGAAASIILEGNNTLKGADSHPAILVPEGFELTVRGEGVLNASGGAFAAAIGGGSGSPNGKITLAGGTLNLYGDNNAAVGAGVGSFTPEGSIIITGGAVKAWTNLDGSAFGTAVQNAEGTPLVLLAVPYGTQSVQIDGRDCGAKAPNDDGLWYVYVPQQKTTVTADGKEYMAMPLTFGEMENGSISAACERNGERIALKDGDMVIEGMSVSLTTVPNEDYGLKSGPDTGSYTVIKGNDELYLSPNTGITYKFQTRDDWAPVMSQSFGSLDALEKEIDGESVLRLGTAEQGTAVFNLIAQGSGVTAELLVGGEVKETLALGDTPQTLSCRWESDGTKEVTVRFTGKGKVSITTMLLGNQVPVSGVKAVFDEVVTFDWEEIEGLVDENGNRQYFLSALKEDGTNPIDLNNFMPGIQLFKGEKLTLSFRDRESGSTFDGFALSWAEGTVETKKENPLTITLNQSVKAKMTYHFEPYYEVVIPEEIAMSDEGASADISVNTIKNMQAGDTLDVRVSGLDENGNATLTRLGTQDTLAVPVTDKDGNQLKNNGLAAQFTENASRQTTGGTVCFGAPAALAGGRKAGDYKGTVTFAIAYQTAGN